MYLIQYSNIVSLTNNKLIKYNVDNISNINDINSINSI